MAAKRFVTQKPIVYCIDGTNLLRDAWFDEKVPEHQEDAGAGDFLKWLTTIQAAPTHTSKAFRVVFDGPPRDLAGRRLKPKGLDVFFSREETADDVLIGQVRFLKTRQERVILVTSDSDLATSARREGVRTITPHDFLMIFQAVIVD